MELGMNRVNLEEVFTWESPCFSAFPRLKIGSTYLVLTGMIYSPCSFLHPVCQGINSLWGQDLEVAFFRHGCPGYWVLFRDVK